MKVVVSADDESLATDKDREVERKPIGAAQTISCVSGEINTTVSRSRASDKRRSSEESTKLKNDCLTPTNGPGDTEVI